jgi:glycosyltransferase involved in cell wall biosynthesis
VTKPLRVLVLNERDLRHPKAGGAEVHVAEIARRLDAMGFEMTQLACSFPGAPARERVEGMDVRRLGGIPGYYLRLPPWVARATARGEFDVVVEHLNKVPFCAAAYSRKPVLAVNHHLFGSSAFLQVAWPIAAAVVAIERLIPRVYRTVPFLAVSESSRADLIDRGIAADHVDILLNGIDPPTLAPVPVDERPERIVYLGRLEAYKRVDLLIEALGALRLRRPDLELVIVGRGAERERLAALAAELGLADRVCFTGFVDDAERDRLVASARLAVCPSVKEGWGITVIECNALGVPVVATDAPGLRDAVRDGETGVLVPDDSPEAFPKRLADAIEALLEDPARLARQADAARVFARRFDWDSSAEQTARALEVVAGRAAG